MTVTLTLTEPNGVSCTEELTTSGALGGSDAAGAGATGATVAMGAPHLRQNLAVSVFSWRQAGHEMVILVVPREKPLNSNGIHLNRYIRFQL